MGMDWLAHHKLKLSAGAASALIHIGLVAAIGQIVFTAVPEPRSDPIVLEIIEIAEAPIEAEPEPETAPVEPAPTERPPPVQPDRSPPEEPEKDDDQSDETQAIDPAEKAESVIITPDEEQEPGPLPDAFGPPQALIVPLPEAPNPYLPDDEEERAAEAARIRELLARPTAEWLEGIDLSARPERVIDIYNFGPADTLREKYIRLERCLALTLDEPRICNTPEGRQLRSFIFEEGRKLIEAGVFDGWDAILAGDAIYGSNFDQLEQAYARYLRTNLDAPVGENGLKVKSSSIGDEGLASERPGTDCHLSSATGFC